MTMDERLERLAGHHEALAQGVELLYATAQQHSLEIKDLIETSRQDGENIRALVRIAEIHERRLTDLEGGNGQ